jgi:glycosyltransferase involved in cell wall biosynthesis
MSHYRFNITLLAGLALTLTGSITSKECLAVPRNLASKDLYLLSVKENFNGPLSPYFLQKLRDLFKVTTFVETGTFLGETTAFAAHVFKEVHTIELSPEIYKKACHNLRCYATTKVHLGDSTKVFPSLLPTLSSGISLFWLDGHYSAVYNHEKTALGTVNTPILQELQQIQKANLQNSIILIDDIRLFDKELKNIKEPAFGGYPSCEELIQTLNITHPHCTTLVVGDVLLVYPQSLAIRPSPVITSCTLSRLYDGKNIPLKVILKAERIIAKAEGAERRFLCRLFDTFCTTFEGLTYGVGKHYVLWRALLAMEDKDYAKAYEWFTFAYNKGLSHWRILWYRAQAAYKANFLNQAQHHLQELLALVPQLKAAQQLYQTVKKEQALRSLQAKNSPYDLTVVGVIKYADGLGRSPIGTIDILHPHLKINFITSRTNNYIDLNDVPAIVATIAQNPDKTPGKVAFFFDLLSVVVDKPFLFLPSSMIKLAYTMVESTAVPKQWVDILNTYFDAAVVPDEFLIEVYKRSGVTIPIFVLPCGLYLEEFLAKTPKQQPQKPFVFGLSAGFWPRKNQKTVIEAFAQEFGNNPDILLKLHGRFGEEAQKKEILDTIKKYKISTIELIDKSLNRAEYLDFMTSLDCYVFLSKGEGFSITPREALALGIPCILSNNTAQKTICNTGFVKVVESPIATPSYYSHIESYVGCDFACSIEDARKALKEVYAHYSVYLKKAHKGREWAKSYLYPNLKNKYLTLIKPQKILLGHCNKVEDTYLITTSKALYKKYQLLNAQ